MKKIKKAVFLFRRDLRTEDNTALNSAFANAEEVIPCFIFDEMQIEKNDYFSEKAFVFMLESLKELKSQIHKQKGTLNIFYGNYEKTLKLILEETSAEAVFLNKDYTPFSIERDRKVEEVCKAKKVNFFISHDYLLNEPEKYLKSDGKPYTVFTHFFNNAKNLEVRKPSHSKEKNYSNFKSGFANEKIFEKFEKKFSANKFVKGGRSFGLEKLEKAKNFQNYENTRDYFEKETTGLSSHLKFGTISIREAYWAIRDSLTVFHPLIRQLFWREFFTCIAYYFPKVFGTEFNEKYSKVEWENNEEKIKRWKEGLTGFPIVDAGMRELNTTGLMHNRARMICASFLVKNLHVDWRIGEKYFAQKLVDYDPAVNNGNWQWAASTGCDAQPYFRVFNPWLQQKKFDHECAYIKKWVKELENSEPAKIHGLEKSGHVENYPCQIVDYKKESQKAKELYEKARFKKSNL